MVFLVSSTSTETRFPYFSPLEIDGGYGETGDTWEYKGTIQGDTGQGICTVGIVGI